MIHQDILNILGWHEEDIHALEMIAYSYIKQGKFTIALTLLEGLHVIDPASLYILQTLGALYLEMKNPLKALDTLEKALKLDPTDDMSLFNKIQALMSCGLKKQALEECQTLLGAKNPVFKQKAEALLLSEALA